MFTARLFHSLYFNSFPSSPDTLHPQKNMKVPLSISSFDGNSRHSSALRPPEDPVSKEVIILAGKYAGHRAEVLHSFKKTLQVLLHPATITVRKSSVKYVTGQDSEVFDDKSVSTVTENPENDPKDLPVHSPAPSPVSSRPPDSNKKCQYSAGMSNCADPLSFGTPVVLIGGSYRGRQGVVLKMHPKMVTLELLDDTKKIVRVQQYNVRASDPQT